MEGEHLLLAELFSIGRQGGHSRGPQKHETGKAPERLTSLQKRKGSPIRGEDKKRRDLENIKIRSMRG